MNVTIITPTIPSRGLLLADAISSVANQETPAADHLIKVDLHGKGPSAIRNDLARSVKTEWMAFLDDDDILYPNYITELSNFQNDFDVIYGFCKMTGRANWIANETFNENTLRKRNFIPVTAMVRTSMFQIVDGFPNQQFSEDHALWINILNVGGRFKCHQKELWEYRYHGSNRTWHGDP